MTGFRRGWVGGGVEEGNSVAPPAAALRPFAALRAERKGLRAGEVSWAFDPGCDGVGPLALGLVVG